MRLTVFNGHRLRVVMGRNASPRGLLRAVDFLSHVHSIPSPARNSTVRSRDRRLRRWIVEQLPNECASVNREKYLYPEGRSK